MSSSIEPKLDSPDNEEGARKRVKTDDDDDSSESQRAQEKRSVVREQWSFEEFTYDGFISGEIGDYAMSDDDDDDDDGSTRIYCVECYEIEQAMQIAGALEDPECQREELNLGIENGPPEITTIAKALRVNKSLRTLRLFESRCRDEGAQALAQELETNNNTLETLGAFTCGIANARAHAFGKMLRINTGLKTLNIQFAGGFFVEHVLGNNLMITAAGARSIAEGLKFNVGLATLDLAGNSIGDGGAESLGDALRSNKTLLCLDLCRNNITHQGAYHLADALKLNVGLTSLALDRNSIGDVGSKTLADVLPINKTLKQLDLCRNTITHQGAHDLAGSLKLNFGLTKLHLDGNGLADLGAERLAADLPFNTTLEKLTLRDCDIADEGATYLEESLRINKGLKSVFLVDNMIGEEGKKALQGVGEFPAARVASCLIGCSSGTSDEGRAIDVLQLVGFAKYNTRGVILNT